jgi:3-oxoacyl-[acyl-carrier-protein] synthase II
LTPPILPLKIAAEIKDFDPSKYVDRKEARKMDPFTLYAVHAAREAMEDSGLTLGENGDKIPHWGYPR